MNTIRRRYVSGQVSARSFAQGTQLVVLEGALRIRYRDASLDWLAGDAPYVAITLNEGEQHVVPCRAWVEIRTEGVDAASAAIAIPADLTRLFIQRALALVRPLRSLYNSRPQ
ncbi:hypothetical protein [Paraburkholderia sp.]|uniref:hypothetical protein n=1 Tax=Paraburkholderia sp. TaxID=1926495 RepID=UPI00239747B6|nr:hypothetical protein [Paraburkholderia sp.]MDE1179846.1 hypothetical protein [Paraburkholderia sp.]